MFRTLPNFGSDPRNVAEIVRQILNGKTNNTGTITLATGNATSTTLNDERISADTKIILIPYSAAANTNTTPYGAFQSLADQTIASTTTAYAMTFDTTDYSEGVYLSNSSRLNVRNAGVYNIQWSGQFQNTDSQIHDVSVWLRKNGSNVAGTTGFISVPNSHGGTPGTIIPSWNYYIQLAANDYLELYWSATNTAITLESYPTQTNPTRPSTASLIATVNYLSGGIQSNVFVSSQTKGSATISHYANSTANVTYGYVLVG
jgi:hypothetical protein